MKFSWHKVVLGLKIAEKVAVMAGQYGVTIQGRNPAEIDAAAHAAATAVIGALKKPSGGPVLVPPSPPGV